MCSHVGVIYIIRCQKEKVCKLKQERPGAEPWVDARPDRLFSPCNPPHGYCGSSHLLEYEYVINKLIAV